MGDIDQRIKDEWRELGFYYDIGETDSKKEWRFYGDKKGLNNFVKLLQDYISNPAHDFLSEHDHYGPYSYLKVMTWNKPVIAEQYIAGTITHLINLKAILADKIERLQAGQSFTIDSEYGLDNTARLKFFMMKDNFDPVSMDKNYS